VIDYFYPEKPIDFNVAWECFERSGKCSFTDCPRDSGKKHLSNVWSGMYSAFQEAWALDYVMDWKEWVLTPSHYTDGNWPWWHCEPVEEWSMHVEAFLNAGWVLLIEMQLDPNGLFTADHKMNHIDHFAVIDGVRSYWKNTYMDGKKIGAAGHTEAHLVCSARGSRWVDVSDLMRLHGVSGAYLVRKRIDYEYRD
jgi:hypothetical protein